MDQRKRVLLVDDVRVFLELEKSFFNREQVIIDIAGHGLEALKVMRHQIPDLVMMDLHMPIMDGAECCRQIKNDPELRAVPVILISNSEHPDDVALCRNDPSPHCPSRTDPSGHSLRLGKQLHPK